ncbi:PucR family transcriptional regulator [Sinomonas mesophila]|uniref:PucR family transcriptional regulator n=1 Tax=Sinomonas mesophila TaxID=1531955 RepID=UPI0009842A22|nr:helix-turn-helix domain-containing protein [Sinomonas mesophila]
MADSGDVQAAVDRLSLALNLSVLVEDRDQRPVWWSTRGSVDQTRMSTILDRHVDPKAAEVVREFNLDRAVGPVRTPEMPERGMWARWCVPARREGRLMGYLWVLDPEHIVGEEDLEPLIECADLAASVLATRHGSAEDVRRRRNELIAALLEGPDAEAARELARQEQLPHDAEVQVDAAVRTGAWPLPGGLYAYPVVTHRRRTATSGSPVPLVALSTAVARARATLTAVAAGARLDPVSWDSLGAWRLVVDAPASLGPADLHPAVEVLRSQQRDELLATARTFLDYGGDVTAAADELHIHRTTLYYRLDRIAELTGVDLRVGATRTPLQLALWLDAYRRALEA